MEYYKTDEKILQIDNLTEDSITDMYNNGYVATRKQKYHFIQTRSLRVDMQDFTLSSENRRILRKTEELTYTLEKLPLSTYSWEIHKLGKDYYTTKFGDKVMS